MTSFPAGPANGAPSNGTNGKSRLEMATKYRSALGLSSSMSYDSMNMARERYDLVISSHFRPETSRAAAVSLIPGIVACPVTYEWNSALR